MAEIEIRNLKNIGLLKFKIPTSGVHLITGTNGSGKTTLLVCLKRIADGNAFRNNFRPSQHENFDDFRDSAITYRHDALEVTYAYRGARWSPTPKRNGIVLNNIGFSGVVHISSNPERFHFQERELNAQGIQPASNFIREAMNELFQTNKYSNLKKKYIDGRGGGTARSNTGFLLPTSLPNVAPTKYASEKNFSLGEIMMLNALFELESPRENSLILIDEIELALHPKVQVAFYRLLEQLARDKQLTVLLSTHSSSLIRVAKNIIFLNRNENTGEVVVDEDCYPAMALQNIAIEEDIQPDHVFFVEDKWARYVLEQLINTFFANQPNRIRPIIKVFPVGGWEDTIRLADNLRGTILHGNTKVVAVLDADVQSAINAMRGKTVRSGSENATLSLFDLVPATRKCLPITPELGIVELLRNEPNSHTGPLRALFVGTFDIASIVRAEALRPGITYSNNPRAAAKTRMYYYVEQVSNATNRLPDYVEWMLAQYFSTNFWTTKRNDAMSFLAPLFT